MSNLTVQLITSFLDVQKEYQSRWNELAGENPLLRWEWLGTWAMHCARSKPLMILVVRDGDQIIGFTPWYVERKRLMGRTICFLGEGRVSTDHLSVLCEPGRENEVAERVAEWLVDSAQNPKSFKYKWNHIEFTGVDFEDPMMTTLKDSLSQRGCSVDQREGLSCFGIDLPATFDEYVARRSRPGRRECRQLLKRLDSGDVEIIKIETQAQLKNMWYDFVDLHNIRRGQTGDEGCFREPGFGEFLWDASTQLLDAGLLRLYFVVVDELSIAAHFAIASSDRWLYYQTGMNSNYAQLKPGKLLMVKAIQDSINEGKSYFDMMRGAESYKRSWRGEQKSQMEIRIAKPKSTAILQQRIWQFGKTIRLWAQSSQ